MVSPIWRALHLDELTTAQEIILVGYLAASTQIEHLLLTEASATIMSRIHRSSVVVVARTQGEGAFKEVLINITRALVTVANEV